MSLLAAAILTAVAVPHLLAREALAPPVGIALWLGALALRALLAISAVVLAIFYLPATEFFELVTHWCFHAVVPLVAAHLGFSVHMVGDLAVLIPAVVLAISVLWVSYGLWRGARAIRRWLQSNSLGSGPAESVVVAGSDVVLAAAGIRSPRVIVSAGALRSLDDAELAAGLEHERAHIARCHRLLSLLASLLFALARLLPGSRRALEELHFQLERDADECAVRRTGDRLALASVICKAALARRPPATAALAPLSGGDVSARVELLLGDDARQGRGGGFLGAALTALVLALSLLIVVSLPALIMGGIEQLALAEAGPVCEA